MARIEHEFIAMGGPCRLRMDCDNDKVVQQAIIAAQSEVERLEQKYSRYLKTSLTSVIHHQAGTGEATSIDSETAGLLRYADTLWQQSDGLFDLTSGSLRRAWDFKSKRIPQQAELDALLPLIGWDKVQWSDESVYLPNAGMELDFGGCVKEYACDSVATILSQLGVHHALIDLAGDMAASGPQQNGEPWPIGIRRPGQRDQAIAEVSLRDGGIASSGNYERFMVIDGERFGHILNPKNGWPVKGLAAVSIMAPQCLVAGSAATIAMLKPEQEALAWLDELGLPWLAIDTQMQCHGQIAE